MATNRFITLDEVIIQRQSAFKYAKGELSRLLSNIGLAATDNINVQGETQQKLDVFAEEMFTKALQASGMVAGIASEEEDDIIIFDDELSLNSNYVICMDPLDGSSNIDVNVSVGTIFSIYRRISKPGTKVVKEDFLQPGNKQVAAGYIIYGSSTMLVYTTGLGTTGFTYEPSIGEFCMSNELMVTPEKGKIYSINEGNYLKRLHLSAHRIVAKRKNPSALRMQPDCFPRRTGWR